ncbi:MAG: pyrimidine 5'-nucleotidase [Blastomonas sp.]
MLPAFTHIRNWIFDLDNTLYAAETNLFALIDVKMGAFIADLLDVDAERARRLQKDYFYRYGTTLAGLMHEHGVDPHAFLDYVHDIDLDRVEASPDLAAQIAALPGRKLIFTNADAGYAERVLARIGLDSHFDAIHDIHATGFQPKPMDHAYHSLCAAHAVDPAQSLFVEDMARNLAPAKALGMTTIWLNNGSEGGGHDLDRDAIDYEIGSLGAWLASLKTGEMA